MWKSIKSHNFFIYTVFYALYITILKRILNIFDLEFMDWFYYFSINFIYITAIIGLFQVILKIKRTAVKRNIIILSVITLLITTFILFSIEAFYYNKAYIIEKNGEKMEVIVSYYNKEPDIQYCKYINPLMRSANYRSHEILRLGADNPFEKDPEYRQYLKFSITHTVTDIYIKIVGTTAEFILDSLVYIFWQNKKMRV